MAARRPLGRGLDALIESEPMRTHADSARTESGGLVMMPIAQITPSAFQPRLIFAEEPLQELMRAIQSQGVLEPLLARPMPGDEHRYELIAGERRLRAAQLAGLEVVPVIVRELDDRAALEASLVENLAREELNAIEEARAFQQLSKQFGVSHDDIATRIGKSRPYVSNTIRLLELPEEVAFMVARGELSPGQARPLLGLLTKEERIAAARKIVEEGSTTRAIEQLANETRKARSGKAKGPGRRAEDPNLLALAESIQRALKRKVRIVRRRGKTPGRIELDYYDDDDLTALAERLLENGANGHGTPASMSVK